MRRLMLSRKAIRVLGLLVLGTLGALVAASLAVADGLPGLTTTLTISTPSVSTPGITTPTLPTTVTVPAVGTTTTTATTPTATTPDATSGSTTQASNLGSGSSVGSTPGTPNTAADPTAIRLPSGGLSVADSSLRAPTRLLVDRIHLSPSTIRTRKQLVTLTLRVRDSAGQLVRGATVKVTGNPTARARTTKSATSIFGTATLRVLTTPIARSSKLFLLLRVSGGPKGVIQTAHLLAVPVRIP
jgi:hypothetical protein